MDGRRQDANTMFAQESRAPREKRGHAKLNGMEFGQWFLPIGGGVHWSQIMAEEPSNP
jgi:hypothetical protein